MINNDTSVLNSLKVSKIILPIAIGLAVIGWMIYKQTDLNELQKIPYNAATFFWLGIAIFMYVLRHLFYAWRLRIMTDYEFSWPKAIQLIFIWEFSSAVSPTSVGGAGVAFFLLAKEKLSGAKTISVVLYSMVVDTLFFVISLPLLYFILGAIMIRPGMNLLSDIDGYGVTFLTVLVLMIGYGGVFFYGLFVNPNTIRKLVLWISKIPFLIKFKPELEETAEEVVITAKTMKTKTMDFHLKAGATTAGAWITRFFAINCLIMAFVSNVDLSILDNLIILGRGEAMHVITSFSPTPGAAGIAEFLFGGFFSEYIPLGIAALIALVWRLISYYTYLVAGAIIIPIWYRGVTSAKNRK